MDQDSGPDVKDSGFSCGPQLSVIDSMPDFKMEHNFALHPAGALSEQSITTRVIVNGKKQLFKFCLIPLLYQIESENWQNRIFNILRS